MIRSILLFAVFLSYSSAAMASDWSGARYWRNALPINSKTLVDPAPIYMDVFRSVDQTKLQTVLKQMTGGIPVTVNGSTFSVTNRYLAADKANFRKFWLRYFADLGISAQEMPFPTRHNVGERQGHNLEAVLPGKSKDSVVIIVHYDSIGPMGDEAGNPAVDDDMSGMAIMMETARILANYKDRLQRTIRFVAADYEELGGLEGARQYSSYLKAKASKENFKIVAAIDNEQSGWNCSNEGSCSDGRGANKFDVFSCSGDFKNYNFPAIGDALAETAAQFSTLEVNRGCIGENSDHYAMWEIGVPAVVFSEHNPFDNPHFDGNGGDTYEKIDQNYFFKIAQIGVVFAARMADIQ